MDFTSVFYDALAGQIATLQHEKEALQADLSAFRDLYAQKQGQIASLLVLLLFQFPHLCRSMCCIDPLSLSLSLCVCVC
jgi:hypothetical protein